MNINELVESDLPTEELLKALDELDCVFTCEVQAGAV